MSYLALNALLALIWMFLSGDFSTGNLIVGLAIGFLAITLSRPVLGSERSVRGTWGVVRFVVVFGRELVRSNLQLARDLLRPSLPFEPGFIAFDIRDLDRTRTVVLAHLVSLTPGTLTVDLDDSGDTLYVHTLYAGDPDEVRRGIRRLADLIHGVTGERVAPAEKERSR